MSESRVVITASADQAVREFDRFRTQATGSLRQISAMGGKLGGLLAGLGASLSVAAVAVFVKGGIDAADAAGKLAQKAGLAVRDVAGLELAYQLAGLSSEVLVTSMSKLSKGIVEGSSAFKALDISSKNSNGTFRSTKDVLYDVADRFAAMENGALKNKLAVDLFSKSGANMIPLLNGGSAGLREMDEMARKLGLTIEQSTVEHAEKFNDTLDLLKMGSQGVARGVAAELLPTLSALAGSFLTSMTSGDKLKKTADFLGTGLKILYSIAMGIVEVFTTVGKVIAGVAAMIMTQLTGAIDVLTKIATGDFKGAWTAAKATISDVGMTAVVVAKDVGSSWVDTGKTIQGAWTGAGAAGVDAQAKMLKAQSDIVAQQAAQEAAAKKAAAAAEAAAKAKVAFVAGLEKEVASLGLSATQIKINEAVTLGLSGAKLQLVKDLLATRDTFQAEEKAAKESAAEHKKFLDSVSETTVQLVAEARAQEESNERAGLGKVALANLDAQRLLNLATLREEKAVLAETVDLSGELSKEYREQAKALRDRAQAVTGGALKEVHQEWLKDSEGAIKKYDEIFSTGFADMLNNGKAGWKSFTKSLTTTFKTTVADQIYKMLAQPFVVKLVGSILGVTGGGPANAAQALTGGADGGPGGVLAAAKTLYSTFSGQLGATLTQAGNLFGSSALSAFGSGMSGTAGAASSVAGSAGASVASSIPMVAAIVASYFGAKAISAGYELGGVGKALNFLGLGGGVVNRLFGRKDKEYTNSTLNGSFGSSGFSGSTDSAWMQKGGVFRSDKEGIDSTAVDSASAQQLTGAYEAIKAASADFAAALGLNADTIKNRAQVLSIALTKDAAENEKAVSAFFTQVGDTIALELVPGLAAFAKSGETAAATLQRIASNYAFVDVALKAIDLTFGATGTASIGARERLVDLAGGIEALGKGTSFFAENFLTEAERMVPVAESVRATMASLGLAWVDTRDEFKSVVTGLDLTSQKGAETFAGLMKVQEGFAKVYPALAATADAAKSAVEALNERAELQSQLDQLTMTSAQLLDKQRAGYDASNRALFDQIQMATRAHESQATAKASLGDLIGNMRSFGNSARTLRDSLLLGSMTNLTPEQQYAEARRQLERTEAAALAGDVAAQGNFAAVQSAFIAISQKVNGGDSKFDADFNRALRTADAIALWTDGQVDVAQASLNVLNDQVAWLSTLNDSIRAIGQGGTTVDLAPRIEVGAPNFARGPVDYTGPMLEGLYALRAEVALLRSDQKVQTGDLIGSAAQIAARSNKAIVQGVGAAVATRLTAANTAVVLE